MTVSMRVMSAGTGYRYLLDSVAVGDGDREPGRALTDYYTQPGCPPGRWLGSGLAVLGDGQLQAGDVVTEVQLGLLLGAGCDPVTGAPLGRAFGTATRPWLPAACGPAPSGTESPAPHPTDPRSAAVPGQGWR